MRTDDVNTLYATDHECDVCGDDILFGDKILVGYVCEINRNLHGQVTYEPRLDAEGDFLFEPLTIEHACGEQAIRELAMETSDFGPSPKYAHEALAVCGNCNEYIIAQEDVLVLALLNVERSKLAPSGRRNCAKFVEPQHPHAPHILCSLCLGLFATVGQFEQLTEFASHEDDNEEQYGH